MSYAPILLGLLTALCWGTADYMSKKQSERVGHYSTVVYTQATTLLVLLALVPFLGLTIPSFPLPVIVLVVVGALNFASFILLYRSFHVGVVSVVAPIAYTYPAVTLVLSVLVLGTSVAPVRILAISAVIVGVVLLSTKFSQLARFAHGAGASSLTSGVGSALGASVFFGTVYLGLGYAAPYVGYVFPAVVLRATAAGIGIALAPLLQQSIRPSRAAVSNTVIAMALLEAVGFLAFTYAVFTSGASLPAVSAISGMGGAVAASYGIYLLGEHLEPNQVLGVFLSLIGVFALLYLGGS